jgi:peptidoglycan/LPS O-acetylase OafA/YrhL
MERIDYIDGLRGLAVLAVVLFHGALLSEGMHKDAPLLVNVLYQGGHGVDLFFVLSGFCLAGPTIARMTAGEPHRFDLHAYSARRFIRIVPPFYAAVALLALLAITLSSARMTIHPSILNLADITTPAILAQLTFVCDLTRCSPLTGPFWSMFIEFRWYFILPLALILFTTSTNLFYAILAALLTANAVHLTSSSLDLTYLPLFLLGIVGAKLAAGSLNRSWPWWFLGSCALFIGSIIDGRMQENLAAGLAAFCFVNATGGSTLLRRVLVLRPFLSLGTASYSIYLVHGPLLWIGGKTAAFLPWPIAYTVSVATALLGGAAFWYVAERPFTRGNLRAALLGLMLRRAPTVA